MSRAVASAFVVASFVSLVASQQAAADIDLLGRTEATFAWAESNGQVDRYDVYRVCGVGSAPVEFDETPWTTRPGDSPNVTFGGEYGWQCKLRVVSHSIDGRVSAVSLVSEPVNFIAPDTAQNDFDGDGYSDIIVQNPDDGSALLISGGNLQSGDAYLHTRTTVSTNGTQDWEIVETGDFNGDGNPDFLWFTETYHQSLDLTTYTYISGSSILDTTVVLNSVTDSEEVIAVSDYDGNGADDILHRTNDLHGTVYVTFMGADGVMGTYRYEGVLQSQFDFVASGDFDDDGTADVMWRRIETGQTVVWLMTRPGRKSFVNSGALLNDQWQGLTAGNFNNSTGHDVLWRNTVTGEILAWYMDDLETPEERLLGATVPSSWSLLATGHLDGDGRADLTWADQAAGVLEIWRMDESVPAGFRAD
ncbi:MAG: VCBS repeat-containing protein [Myxococcota bacterium]|nr:VCBS repeat-containing protein [Myxococcota bacterium]